MLPPACVEDAAVHGRSGRPRLLPVVTTTDVLSSLEYFYAGEKEPEELAPVTALFTSETKRGQFLPITRLAQLHAFVTAWHHAKSPELREKFAQRARETLWELFIIGTRGARASVFPC